MTRRLTLAGVGEVWPLLAVHVGASTVPSWWGPARRTSCTAMDEQHPIDDADPQAAGDRRRGARHWFR